MIPFLIILLKGLGTEVLWNILRTRKCILINVMSKISQLMWNEAFNKLHPSAATLLKTYQTNWHWQICDYHYSNPFQFILVNTTVPYIKRGPESRVRSWLGPYLAPSQHINKLWIIVQRTLYIKEQWLFIDNATKSIHGNKIISAFYLNLSTETILHHN